jgi:chromosome segregation ATPase
MAITKEQIWRVADELVEAGGSPTLATIRKRVGGGSFTTISEAMAEWRRREQQKARVEELVIPDEIKGVALDAGRAVWRTALELARSEVDGIKVALEAREKEIVRERAEALALADQVSNDLEQAQAEIDRLKEQLSQAQNQAREAQAVSAEREQRIFVIERELKENRQAADKVSARAERLDGELGRVRSELESQAKDLAGERDARSQTEKHVERLTADLDAARRDKDRLLDEMGALKLKQEEAKTEYKRQFQKFTGQMEAEKDRRAQAESISAELRIENARLKERSERAEVRLKELAEQVGLLQERLVKLAESKG